MSVSVAVLDPARLRDDPIGSLRALARDHGPVVRFEMHGRSVLLVSDPARIHEVLVTRASDFAKHQTRDRGTCLLGNGLMTSDDATNRTQRRHMAALFSHGRLQRYRTVMAQAAEAWSGSQVLGARIDIVEEMGALTLDIAARCLLGVTLDNDVHTIREALLTCLDAVTHPDMETRMREGRARLDRVVDPLIAARREALARRGDGACDADDDDLISLLLEAGNPDRLIGDEVITMLLGAHETTASALGWTWWRLDGHREVAQRFREEIEPPGRTSWPFTRAVISETLRLHSPGWIIGRVATCDTRIGDAPVEKDAIVLMSPAVVHHDSALYPDPDRFDPTRFLGDVSRPRWAFFPFGGGARTCIGEQFAWLEMETVLAVVGRRLRFEAVADHPVEVQALAALRPRWGLKVTVCAA